MFTFFMIYIITSLVGVYGDDLLSVFPASIKVREGDGIALQVIPPQKGLVNCTVSFNGQQINLIPGRENLTGASYYGAGYEKGECGAKVHKFKAEHANRWVFTLVLNDGRTNTAYANVALADPDNTSSLQPEIINTTLGEELTIKCEAGDAFYCRLISPENKVVSSGANCTQFLNSTKMWDQGEWQCALGVTWAAREVVKIINVTIHTVQNLEIGQSVTDGATIIFCNLKKSKITFCRWERRDGEVYIMSEGRSIDRYTYYGKGISERECGLSIQKPLTDEDLRTWTCTLGLEEGGRSGGFINIDHPTNVRKTLLETKQPVGVYALTGSELTLDCSVDFALSYCWFKHPNGTRYYPSTDDEQGSWSYHGDGTALGQCGMKIHEAKPDDSGQWTCGMGVQGEYQATQDLQSQFMVTVSDIPFVQNETLITASTGDWAILACHSLIGEAIQYCSFIAPNGTSYNIIPGQTSQRVQYKGMGLEYGDCGILISPVQKFDYGTWQCLTKLATSKYGLQLTRQITLNPPSLLSSSALGISVGIGIAVALTIFVIWYKRKYSKRNQQPVRTSDEFPVRPSVALSNFSDTSDDVIYSPTNP